MMQARIKSIRCCAAVCLAGLAACTTPHAVRVNCSGPLRPINTLPRPAPADARADAAAARGHEHD